MGRHFEDHPVHSFNILYMWTDHKEETWKLLIFHSVVGDDSGKTLIRFTMILNTDFMIDKL